jgi:MFS family permease
MCTHFIIGHQYVFGTIEVYATSYLKQFDPSLTLNDTYIGIPCVVILSTIMMFFGPKMAHGFGFKITVGLAIGLVMIAQIVMATTKDWVVFLVAFIGCCGCAVGWGYLPALMCGWNYFPWHKGRISGMVLMCFGFGAFILSIVGTAIVNPMNFKASIVEAYGTTKYTYFPKEIADRVP